MKLVFIHDGPLFYDKDGNYYEFAYHELYERYSYMADKITFLIRTKPVEGKTFTLVPPQIEVISVPNFKSPKTILVNKPKAEKIVEKCVRENDVFVLRTQSSIAQLAVKYIRKYNKPYIVESVGCSWDSYWNHGLLGKAVAPYMYYKTRSIIGKAKYVYYVTGKFLQRRYPTKGYTVSCSNVVIDEPADTTLVKRLEKLKGFDPHKKLILGTAAALDTRYKGQEYVIRAIKPLTEMGYDVEYHMAGGYNGTKHDYFLRDLAKELGVTDRVKFVGNLSADKMPEYYDSLDIYVQPSKQEGLPRAVIEAMSRGCPVIGTNIAGIPELISKICLFRKGSDTEVIKAVERVLGTDLEKLAKRNFAKSKEFSREKLIKKREAFYDVFLSEYGK
ncbi:MULTISPECIES: glycosyltransferase family 4 protein [Ruminococcus]|uniref:Glycosyl transferase group 1 n=1 Tax=Ruminococcus albus (strain ATCC 27210 / DSM 20455 / JCM 14654 / NCDO 2250 / 7) TaxID=697329 RepID=E6UEJ7_RUMA7|nr:MULTISPECIES: glycosyltransferase family 4 protein [Ruminococcus]ADU20952.1 glycosyl transferase group 1 [Ruminococcus albus 7 = DSM 20455]MCR5019362.1 glycosyltransferase family 4 protein [Ruminococcus sp.]